MQVSVSRFLVTEYLDYQLHTHTFIYIYVERGYIFGEIFKYRIQFLDIDTVDVVIESAMLKMVL